MVVRDRRPLPILVRDGIRDLISDTNLSVGDQVPTEHEIAQRFDVGRTTVREALKLLEQDGVIQVRHGRGRFVAAVPTLRRPITRLESVTEMMRSLGYEVANRVLNVTQGAATEDEAKALGIELGEGVLRLERLRLHDDEPLIYSLDVLPASFVGADLPHQDFTGSLLAELERHGYRVASATAEIKAVTMPRSLERRLGVRAGLAWLLMDHVNLGDNGLPIIYSHDYYRGDMVSFNVVRRRLE